MSLFSNYIAFVRAICREGNVYALFDDIPVIFSLLDNVIFLSPETVVWVMYEPSMTTLLRRPSVYYEVTLTSHESVP